MAQTLNVIALISGGKDSIYSILHCTQNGHKVVALGNLYPQSPNPEEPHDDHVKGSEHKNEHDLNSFMYQTVGHTVIPLYEQVLGVPLYRQPIVGGAVSRGTKYVASTDETDETESLVPLLKRILVAHPEANALSTGAILSTYQRTRVESVALRLGLEPLSFLWQYPALPPETQSSLLEDMASVGVDARIIKVASGGLDESFLWRNVASRQGIQGLERAMGRFGIDDDGAVLGEGGEFETLVLDGPDCLFKGRVVVQEEDRVVVREGGGTAWLAIRSARVEMKDGDGRQKEETVLRIPGLLESRFSKTLWPLQEDANFSMLPEVEDMSIRDSTRGLQPRSIKADHIVSRRRGTDQKWIFAARMLDDSTVEREVEDIVEQMRGAFQDQNVKVSDIVSTVIILRSMKDFIAVNKVYGALFNEANPPSRVTIACGDVLPPRHNILIHLNPFRKHELSHLRRALHVQSRSYWAPANIGPYSQAQSIPLSHECELISGPSQVHIAGQIALVPATMALPERSGTSPAHQISDFKAQILLSLQHLFRIGRVMHVSWFTGAVAYLSRERGDISIVVRARMAGLAWRHQHARRKRISAATHRSDTEDMGDDDDSEEDDQPPRDLWEERHHFGLHHHSSPQHPKPPLPNWSVVSSSSSSSPKSTPLPPFFAAEVQSLPRSSPIEWVALSGLCLGTENPAKLSASIISFPLPLSSSSDSSSSVSAEKTKEEKTTKKYTYTYHIIRIDRVIEEVLLMLPRFEDSCINDDDDKGEKEKWKEILRQCCEDGIGIGVGKSGEREEGKANNGGYHGAESAWLDVSIPELWEAEDGKEVMDWTGVVPCWSLWDGDGRRLGAVLRFCRDLTA